MLTPSLSIVVVALILAGCQSRAERDPLPYSPNYGTAKATPPIRKGYDAPSGHLVPDACVTPDLAEDPLYLPPGCANNMNLELMVERQSDLLRGRKTGPAMAAPVVRAARSVIDGTTPREPVSASDLNTTRLKN